MAIGSLDDQLLKIYAKTFVRSVRNAGRTGTSQLPNSKRLGSKAAKNSSIPTEKRTSKPLAGRHGVVRLHEGLYNDRPQMR
jgi:hypothetical protein